MRITIPKLLFLLLLPVASLAQSNDGDNADAPKQDISEKSLHFINDKYSKLTDAVDKQTEKMLERMQRKEARLKEKVQNKDSSKAQQLFANTQTKYQQLQAKLQSPVNPAVANPLKQYVPGIDSLQTSLQFLTTGSLPIPADKLAQIQAISSQLQQLQARMQQANDAQQFVRDREQQLKDQLSNYGVGKQLLGLNQQVYYYQVQLQQYKDLINDKQKLEEAVLNAVRQSPAFQSFWQRNSLLAQLFPMPENFGTPAALAGLQTRSQLQSLLPAGLSSASAAPGGSQILQQQFQQAQTQMNTLKDKVSQLGGGSGSGDMTMPDFVPNSQHTKSFLRRLTWGFDFQTQSATNLLPAISTMGLTLGYKLSDKATVGVGTSYLLGLGNGFNHIRLSNQGAGLRSFVDIKAKKSIWITAGFEYDYMQAFTKLRDIENLNIWQRSALAGVTKKYKITKNKEGNIQLLYDFLYRQERPQAQPFVFRFGYSF